MSAAAVWICERPFTRIISGFFLQNCRKILGTLPIMYQYWYVSDLTDDARTQCRTMESSFLLVWPSPRIVCDFAKVKCMLRVAAGRLSR